MAESDDAPANGAPDETPIQKALRLKKASQAGRGGPPGRGALEGERTAAARSQSKSKPWMKK